MVPPKKSLVRFNERAYCDETLSLDKHPRPSEADDVPLKRVCGANLESAKFNFKFEGVAATLSDKCRINIG